MKHTKAESCLNQLFDILYYAVNNKDFEEIAFIAYEIGEQFNNSLARILNTPGLSDEEIIHAIKEEYGFDDNEDGE